MGLYKGFNEEGEFAPNSYSTRSVDNGTPDKNISVPGGLKEQPNAKPYDLKSISVPGGDGEAPHAKPYDNRSIGGGKGTNLSDTTWNDAVIALHKTFKEGYKMAGMLMEAKGLIDSGGGNDMSDNLFSFDESYDLLTEAGTRSGGTMYSHIKSVWGKNEDSEFPYANDKKEYERLLDLEREHMSEQYEEYKSNTDGKVKSQSKWDEDYIINAIKANKFGMSSGAVKKLQNNYASQQAKKEVKDQKDANKLNDKTHKEYDRNLQKRIASEAETLCAKEAQKALDLILSSGSKVGNEKKWIKNYTKDNIKGCIERVTAALNDRKYESYDIVEDIYSEFLYESSIYESIHGDE